MLTEIVKSRTDNQRLFNTHLDDNIDDTAIMVEGPYKNPSFSTDTVHENSSILVKESELIKQCEFLRHKVSNQEKAIRKLILGSYESIVNAIEAKDRYTAGHSRRVAAITEIIAQLIGFNQTDLEDLCWGALLHDVGKIAIDPAIQNKPGKLTDDEYKQIMLHTQIGPDIVRPIVKSDILDIIRCHHFRYDGQGINQMNEGVEIPIGARIVAIADTYDAMTTDRPYRKALPKETAFQEISKCSGTQFDPDITLVFIKARDILSNPENIDNNIKNIIYV